MPIFAYTALDNTQNQVKGTAAAGSKEELARELTQQGYTPLKIKIASGSVGRGRLPIIEKITICRYLSTMLKSGLTLIESVQVLADEVKHPVSKKIMEDMRFGLSHGQQLSTVLMRYPESFDNFFITLVKSGEVSGTLVQSFEQLQEEIRAEYSLKQKIQSAMMYPMVVFVAMFGIGILMFFFILPQIGKVFFSLNLPLNPAVMFLFRTVVVADKYKYFILTGLVIAGILLFLFARTNPGRKMLGLILRTIPVIKNLTKQIDIARFCRTFSTLIASGVPITETLEISLNSLSYAGFKDASNDIVTDLSQGKSLAEAFRSSKSFPPMLIQMMVAGEKSGSLDSTLRDLAEFYEEEVENAIKKLVQLLEPLMMLLVGIGVGVMILSVIAPIYSVVSNIEAAR